MISYTIALEFRFERELGVQGPRFPPGCILRDIWEFPPWKERVVLMNLDDVISYYNIEMHVVKIKVKSSMETKRTSVAHYSVRPFE